MKLMRCTPAAELKYLAKIYCERQLYVEAEKVCKAAIEMQTHDLGSDHVDVSVSLYQLAEIYSAQGKYVEAKPLYDQAVVIYGKLGVCERLDLLWCVGDLLKLHELAEREAAVQHTQSDIDITAA